MMAGKFTLEIEDCLSATERAKLSERRVIPYSECVPNLCKTDELVTASVTSKSKGDMARGTDGPQMQRSVFARGCKSGGGIFPIILTHCITPQI